MLSSLYNIYDYVILNKIYNVMNEYIKVAYLWVEENIPNDDSREDEIYVWEEEEEGLIAFVPKYIYEEIEGKPLIITLN